MRTPVAVVASVLALVPLSNARAESLQELSEKNRKAKPLEELVAPISADELAGLKKRDPASFLFLNGLKALTAEQAGVVAASRAQVAVLPDLAALDVAAAEALARWPGQVLLLTGLKALDPEVAKKLAAWPGKRLFLDGLAALEPGAAAGLAAWPGAFLSLRGVKITPGAAKELGKFKGFVAVTTGSGERKSGVKNAKPEELRKLSQAIVDGKVEPVRAWLDGGGSPEASERGTTLLMEAAYFKQVAIAKLLVEKGADPNARSDDHRTPLLYALDYPRFPKELPEDPAAVLALVTLLLDAKADPNPKKDAEPGRDAALMFAPPLTRAAELGDLAVVELLLARGADPNGTDYRGYGALVGAVNKGQRAVVAKLLEAGAAVNPKDPPRAGIPLHQAVSQPAIQLRMAEMRAKMKGQPFDAKAREKDAVAIVELLLEKGADPEAPNESGATPLLAAINSGMVSLVEAVGAKANLDRKDPKGEAPLHALAGSKRLKEEDALPIAEALVKRKVDRAAKDAAGLTAAEVAEKRGWKKLAAALAP